MNHYKKGLVVGMIVTFVFVIVVLMSTNIKVCINGEELEEYKQTVEYKEGIDISPNSLGFQVEYRGEDITELLEHASVVVNELKTYTITYSYENKSFDYVIDVVDTTKPEISVIGKYLIEQGNTLKLEGVEYVVSDNFDTKVTVTLDDVDTSIPGTYEVEIHAVDSSNNKATTMIEIDVLEKKEIKKITTGQVMEVLVVNNPEDITSYISKQTYIPEGWAPSDLVSLGGRHSLRKEAANAYKEMIAGALLDDIHIQLVSSYRSHNYQKGLYKNYYALDPNNVDIYSAHPRSSEHELGLAIDVSYDYTLHHNLDDHPVGKWMMENCHKYGWTLSYPENKVDYTGYMFEPWHYRYVGIELATTLHDQKITLGEYYHQ